MLFRSIDISNMGTSSTNLIGDISGYFTALGEDTASAQVYHTVNPTRLVDTRNGIGGITGPLKSAEIYPLSDIAQITTATTPTLAVMLTVTVPVDAGDLVAYPDGTSNPGTSNLNWSANQTIANMALAPTATDNTVDLLNSSSGTIQLIVDCSGYFASY